MEQYKKLINVEKVNSRDMQVSYLDYNTILPSNKQLQTNSLLSTSSLSNQFNYLQEISMQYFTKYEKLVENDISIIEKSIIKKIVELSYKNAKSDTYEQSRLDIEELNIDTRKILSKIMLASNRIAVESRIGPATNILISKETFYHFKLDTLVQISYDEDNLKLLGLDIIFNENVSDIYVFRINKSEQVGLSLLYTADNHYCICEKGNCPEKSFVKIGLSKKLQRMRKLRSL